MRGDWGAAKSIFDKFPNHIRAEISRFEDRPLHIAAAANRSGFMHKLMTPQNFQPQDLETKNRDDNTPFFLAAMTGNTELVELMLKVNDELPLIRGNRDQLPIQVAASLGHKDMVKFLYPYITCLFAMAYIITFTAF